MAATSSGHQNVPLRLLERLSCFSGHLQKKMTKKKEKKTQHPRPGKDESKRLMEIVACFLRHTSFLPIWSPHLCTPSHESPLLWLVDWLGCLLLSFLGFACCFGGFLFYFFFSGFFPSFPCIYACGVYASSLRTLLGTLRLAWGYHRASGKSWPCRHGTFPASSSCGSPSSFIASPWSCPVFARGGKTPCICS